MVVINGVFIKNFKNCNSVIINGGVLNVNGKTINLNKIPEKEIQITIEGNVEHLDVDACSTILVNGSANQLQTQSGYVTVTGDVNGNVSTMSGDVNCKEIKGNISTMSGNIRCGTNSGNIHL